MGLQVVAIKSELGILKYFGEKYEVKERSFVGADRTEKVVGYRYKLLSFSGLGKEVIVNTKHTVPKSIPLGSTVELVNPFIKAGFELINGNAVAKVIIWADDIQVVND